MKANQTLWSDSYLENFAKNTLTNTPQLHYWFNDPKTGALKISEEIFFTEFMPALGIHNIDFGMDKNGISSTTLVFKRGNRCQEIEGETILSVIKKINLHLGKLGSKLNVLVVKKKVLSPSSLDSIESIYDMKPLLADKDNAYFFFTNGWIEINKNGVSKIKTYGEIPDGYFVWNRNIIPQEWHEVETKAVLEAQSQFLIKESKHPITKEDLSKNEVGDLYKAYEEKIKNFNGVEPDTHYRDFITNLSRTSFAKQEINEETLNRLKLAIGYLCHSYNMPSSRKAVVAVEKFYAGMDRNSADGGTGKSILFKSLRNQYGGLLNYVECNGKEFIKNRHDSFTYAEVQHSTQLVHFADAQSQTFDTERLFNQITDDFSVRKRGGILFTIPSTNAPKLCVSSNAPLKGTGTSFDRRQFIVEVGGYYRDLLENHNITPFTHHGNKHIADIEWDSNDWIEYYRFIFECIQLYLSQPNGLPHTRGSAEYDYRKLVEETDSEDMSEWLVEKVKEYQDIGGEFFVEQFYGDCRKANPQETKRIKNNRTLWNYLVLAGRVENLDFVLDKYRLTKPRYDKWVKAGLQHWQDRNGRVKKEGDKIQFFVFHKKNVKSVIPVVVPPTLSTSGSTSTKTTTSTKVKTKSKN